MIPWVIGIFGAALLAFLAFQVVKALRRSRDRWRFFREEARKYKERSRKS